MAPPAYGAFHVAQNAFVAQSVERVLGKDEVSSSILDKGSRAKDQASSLKNAGAFLFCRKRTGSAALAQRFPPESLFLLHLTSSPA